MPTECRPTLFEFAPVQSHAVVVVFDGGTITSVAGGLLREQLTERSGW